MLLLMATSIHLTTSSSSKETNMPELIAIDTVNAYTLEVGDTVNWYGDNISVKSILDLDDLTISGTDEFGDDVEFRIDPYFKIDVMGYAVDEDEDI